MITVWIPRPYEQGLITKSLLDSTKFNAICDPVMYIKHERFYLNQSFPYQAVIVTSQHAVYALTSINYDCAIFTVGNTTFKEVIKLNRFKNVYNANGNHIALARLINQHCKPKYGALLYLHGYHYTNQLESILRRLRFNLDTHICYQANKTFHLSKGIVERIQTGEPGIILVYSKRQGDMIYAHLKDYKLENFMKNWITIAMSSVCTQALIQLNFKRLIIANHPSDEAMIKTTEQYYDQFIRTSQFITS